MDGIQDDEDIVSRMGSVIEQSEQSQILNQCKQILCQPFKESPHITFTPYQNTQFLLHSHPPMPFLVLPPSLLLTMNSAVTSMQADDTSLLCSMGLMQTQTSLTNLLPDGKAPIRRFKRSCSGQRSRSKENHRSNDEPSFFVRNIFQQTETSNTPERSDATPHKVKRRNNHMRNRQTQSAHKQNEVQMLYRKCNEMNVLLERSHSYIMELEGKVMQLEEEVKTGRGKEVKENRSANLAKLRKQIADTRTIETVPIQALSQQIKMLQAENLCLKEEVQTFKQTIKQQQEIANNARSQRENELYTMIQHLRASLIGSQKRQDQLRMQVGRLRLRESKLTDNQQQARNQQLSYLRFRYQKMRKKFEQNKKALQALQRKQEANSYLFPQQQRQVSFSLSP